MEHVLDELFPTLEALETQSGAIVQFLKERGIASDSDLAPFVEQAAKASNVRWRAARVRIDHLLSGAAKAAEASEEKERAVTEKERAMTRTKIDTNRDPEVSKQAPEGPRDSEEPPERAPTTAADKSFEKGPDVGEAGQKEEGKKKNESRGTEEGKAGKPASEDAA
jgi:hypothetical protein